MKKFFKKYKLLLSILIISFIMFPFTIYKSAETDRVAVATSIGIDKKDDNIELSLNVITPSSQTTASGGSMGSVKTFSGEGKNISMAISKLSLSVGKLVGLAHCDAVVISKDLLNEDITKILDYFIRSNNLTNNAVIFVTDGKAKDVIKASAQESSSFALTLSDIVSFNKMLSFGDSTNIDNFYINYFSPSSISVFPVLTTGPEDEDVSNGGSQSSSSSNLEGSNQEGQQSKQNNNQSLSGGMQSGGMQNKNVIKNNGKIVVVKHGKFVCELNDLQVSALNIINPKTYKGNLTAKNVNNDKFKNADLTYQIYDKKVKTNCYFLDGVPIFNFDISLILQIKEIVMDNYEIETINGTTAFLDDEVKKALTLTVHKTLASLINLSKTESIDIFDVYDLFYKYNNKQWEQYIKSLNNPEDFLDKVVFTINLNMEGKL